MNIDILLVFGKSYQVKTNNEKCFQSIIAFNVHSMLRDIELGLGCHILSIYGFFKVP